jgi:exodeoxyribonuclease-3
MTVSAGQQALIGLPKIEPAYIAEPGRLRILTLNVQRAAPARALRQAAWLAAQPLDVAVLTEVAAGASGDALSDALTAHGFTTHFATHAGGPDLAHRASQKPDYRVLIAGRTGKISPAPQVSTTCLPHRCVAVRNHLAPPTTADASTGGAAAPGTTVGIVGLYVPSRGPKERRNVDKRAFQSAVTDLLPELAALLAVDGPIIITGDLNVLEPGHRPHHAVFGRWEYDFYRAFNSAGYTDAYRHLHPDTVEHSWYGRRSGLGYRFDHTFSSAPNAILECRYLHEAHTETLSDHAAMLTVIGVPRHRSNFRCENTKT